MNLSTLFIAVLLASAGGLYLADTVLPKVLARTADTADYRFYANARGWLKGASIAGGVWLLVMGAMMLGQGLSQ